MKISQALRTTRKKIKMTQTNAANSACISQTYLSQIESGFKIPTIDVIEKICAVYKVPFPIMMWFALTVDDIQWSKKYHYKKIKPVIDNLIAEFFIY